MRPSRKPQKPNCSLIPSCFRTWTLALMMQPSCLVLVYWFRNFLTACTSVARPLLGVSSNVISRPPFTLVFSIASSLVNATVYSLITHLSQPHHCSGSVVDKRTAHCRRTNLIIRSMKHWRDRLDVFSFLVPAYGAYIKCVFWVVDDFKLSTIHVIRICWPSNYLL